MTMGEMSRRVLLVAGAGALASACGASTAATSPPAVPAAGASGATGAQGGTTDQETIRKWYAAWEKTDWSPVEALMTDDFTFSSAAGDDHISKSTYKAQCWESQKGRIERFELEQVIGNGDAAFVRYLCHTKNGKSFRNVEYFKFRDGKIVSIECYFGDAAGYPSAADAGKKGS
jgi:ketosteroid isomerase-like protein